MSNYKTYIGLEVHIQSKTKSKMFCSCDANYFGAEPNTHTCPVCLGMPGALPVANKVAIEKCIKLALALNCNVNQLTKFDRKNYFYPDLPKAYQISQYDLPIGENGYLEISGGETDDDKTRIRIRRVHQEEDTAKSIHSNLGSVIDCNKSGVPLVEVVTEPDFENSDQVLEFARKLQQVVRYCEISDANMEMGQMRFELNISVGLTHPVPSEHPSQDGNKLPNYKVEVKNISSISILQKVIEFEEKRQRELLEQNQTPIQETRGIDDLTGETYSQRVKEDAEDYRYFPEPDLPIIKISDEELTRINNSIPELPDQKLIRYTTKLNLPQDQAEIIISEIAKMKFFESVIIDNSENPEFIKQSANFIVGELSALLKKRSEEFENMKLSQVQFSQIIELLIQNQISGATVKKLLEIYLNGESIAISEYVEKNDLIQISDETKILPIVLEIISNNSKIVEDYKSGKVAAKGSLVGQIMAKFKGKANPQVIDKIVEEVLAKAS